MLGLRLIAPCMTFFLAGIVAITLVIGALCARGSATSGLVTLLVCPERNTAVSIQLTGTDL